MLSRAGTFSLLAVSCLTIMVGCVIVPGLPSIARHLGTADVASWLVTLPSLGVVLFGPLAGWLITRLGARMALKIGLLLYGALGVSGAFLQGAASVMTDRLLLGGATALVMASGTGLLSDFFDGADRLRMIARQGMAIELGGVIFLSIGGVLAGIDWRLPFGLYLFAWIMLMLISLTVPAPMRHSSETTDATPPAAARLGAVYTFALLSMIVFFAAIVSLPASLARLGLSEAQTGYFLSFVSLVAVGAAYCLPRVAARIGEFMTMLTGFGSYALAHFIFATAQGVPFMISGAVLLGGGFGLTVPLVNHMTVERSHSAQRGKALAYLSMAIFLGQFLSTIVTQAVGGGQAADLAAIAVALAGALLAITLFFRREAKGRAATP